jgi:hypothetical protein
LLEWTNPRTLGGLDCDDRLWASWFQGVTTRKAGFNTVGSREFQRRAADEVALLPEGSAIVEMLSGYAVVREQVRACRESVLIGWRG